MTVLPHPMISDLLGYDPKVCFGLLGGFPIESGLLHKLLTFGHGLRPVPKGELKDIAYLMLK